MALTKVTSGVRTLGTGEVAIGNISGSAAGAVGSFLKQDGTWAAVPATDTSVIEDDIALLGFKVAVVGSKGKYNLVDQTEDAFMDATGIDASASTGETRNAANYYSGEAPTTAVTGGTITTDESYKVHTFLTDGTLTTYASGNVEYLVVGGGGSGGGSLGSGWPGAGGGAGGFRTAVGFATTAQAYGITVGDGAAANGTVAAESSIFSTITSTGGGYGGKGSYPSGATAGGDGGSGGGGGHSLTAMAGGAALPVTSPVQGYAGGDGHISGYWSGGGGGASAVGGSAVNGTGGAGTASVFSGASVTYSTGGNGGSGSAGAANTGDGGDGTSSSGNAGGSGIVIIRYLTNAFSTFSNMVLQSNSTTANDGAPTKGDIVMTYTNGSGTATLNTDLTAEFSANNGTNWTSMTLVAQGSTGTHLIVSAHDVTVGTAGTAMKYRIKTLNQSISKETRIQAVSLGWS